MSMVRLVVHALALGTFGLFGPGVAAAQHAPAVCGVDAQRAEIEIAGTVSDTSGARIAGAIVIAECGVVRHDTVTDAEGGFRLRLRPGSYQLHAVKDGFEPLDQSLVTATIGGGRVDLRLAVGQFTQNITVVSAAGNERTLADAPASISVITQQELENAPVRDLSYVLQHVAGVTANRTGNSVPGIQVRGLDSAYTLMLIDGQRVNATAAMFRGNDYDTGWVPAEAIERVEVVRGPMSSIYGSDAIGGVVNIITKRIGARWNGSLTTTGTLQQDAEAGDAYSAAYSVSGPVIRDRLGIKSYGGVDHRDADGAVNERVGAATTAQAGFPVNDNKFAAFEVSVVPGTSSDLSFRYDRSDRDHGGFEMERRAGSATHRGKWSRATSELVVYGDVIRNLTGTVTGQVNPNRYGKLASDGRLNVPFGRHVVTAGGAFRRETLDDPTNLAGLPGTANYGRVDPLAITQSAAFVEADLALGPALRLTLGDRFDHHENFGGNHSPRIYGVYHLGRIATLKGGVSRAFRAPTLLQNSPNWGSPSCGNATTGCFIIGSLELEPETSTSYEAGAQLAGSAWSGGATWFRNDLRNMIDITNRTNNAALAPTLPNFIGFLPAGAPGFGRPIFRYQNINKVQTQGVETSGRASLPAGITARASYTYVKAENQSGASPLPLIYRPAHSVSGSVDWQATARVSLSATARSSSRQYTSVPANGLNLVSRPAYAMVDVSTGVKVARMASIRGGVLNVMNKTWDRATAADFNEEGRRYFAMLSLRY